MRRLRTWAVLGILMELGGARGPTLRASEPPVYEVYAVRYARLLGYPVASLVQGADPERKLDLAMTVWVLKGPGNRTVLVDTGFYRPEIMEAQRCRRLHPAGQGTRAARDQRGTRHRRRHHAHALGPRRRRRPVSEGAGLDPEEGVRPFRRCGPEEQPPTTTAGSRVITRR